MKQSLMGYLISLGFLVLGSFLVSGLLSALYYYHVLSTQLYEWVALGFGLVLFLAAGLLLGRKTTKKALIHALVVVVPFLLVAVLAQEFAWLPILTSFGKSLTYVLGTIIGVNVSHSK